MGTVGHGSRRLRASWQAVCLDDSLLLSFEGARSKGFTILFKQSRPDVFRLFTEALSVEDLKGELVPARALPVLESGDGALESAFRELQRWEAESQLAQQKFIEAEKAIADGKVRICALSPGLDVCSSKSKCNTIHCFLTRLWGKLSAIVASMSRYFESRPTNGAEIPLKVDDGISYQSDASDGDLYGHDELDGHDELGEPVYVTPTTAASARPTRDVHPTATPLSSQNVTRSHDPEPQFLHPRLDPLARTLILLAFLPLIGIILFVVFHRFIQHRRRARKLKHKRRWTAVRERVLKLWCPHPTDYEEKRALVLEQEGILQDVMQVEIQQATSPEQVARDLAPQPPRLARRRTDSLPSYRRNSNASSRSAASGNPPPQYDEEFNGDVDVVDGFTFSQLYGGHRRFESDGFAESVDTSPDSSVVDCSPRMSFDTGRTALSTKKEDKEEHN